MLWILISNTRYVNMAQSHNRQYLENGLDYISLFLKHASEILGSMPKRHVTVLAYL